MEEDLTLLFPFETDRAFAASFRMSPSHEFATSFLPQICIEPHRSAS